MTGQPRRVTVRIRRLPHSIGIALPQYMSEHAAGMDIPAALDSDLVIRPGEIHLVPTGISVAIPEDYEIQVRPRSGLAIRKGLTVVNAPGTIDPDYRGEIKIGLVNLGKEPVTVSRGDRIAQLVLARRFQLRWEEVSSLEPTARNEGGFGHTGVD